jgi:ferredoxin
MPWVDKSMCIGCGICVDECPVDVIVMEDEVAEIYMNDCIHCGRCHDVCDQEAVRHDSEKIPDAVKSNVDNTRYYMDACQKYLGDDKEGQLCLNRMIKHFTNEKIVAEKTLEALALLRK